MVNQLNNSIVKATKWSVTTEIIAKLITPVTNIVLARLLTPEAFGVVATLTMVISFAEIFTDVGFQKYLIQHEFKEVEDKEQSTNVAFWSNLALSLLIWLVIGVFCEPLAKLVGNAGLGNVLTIACVSIPITAFSSIQIALYKRDLDFKTLFKVRIVGICVPLVVTIPIAFYFRSFWALVIGTIVSNLVNAVLLTIYSKWKPKFYYSMKKLKEMFSFAYWSLIEALAIWLTGYIDIFIIGIYLNEYYLGLYKTSMVVVGQIMGLITSATTPIIFSSLSRLQNDNMAFNALFLKFQRVLGILIIPMGVGLFCYSDLVTELLLGSQWMEASRFIGLWGLTSALTIVLGHYCSEVYRAKGRPRLSVLAQFLHIVILVPTVIVAVKYGFEVLYTARAIVRLELILVHLVIMQIIVGISFSNMFANIKNSCIATFCMWLLSVGLSYYSSSFLWQFVSVFLCICVYFISFCCFPDARKDLKLLIKRVSK